MNTQPEAPSGRVYWRGLDELAETPEFRNWVDREFPEGAGEWADPVSRRHFIKLMSASFLLAGAGFAGSGCRRPAEHLEPFGQAPENYVHGTPRYFATAMPAPGGALPLVVKSYEGRPTKIEGNKLHPDSNGGTDRFAQASILGLYDPDRAARFTHLGNNVTREAAFDFLAGLARSAESNRGQGLAFLMERSDSPSRQRLQKLAAGKFPLAGWYAHDPIDLDIHRRAASLAFGRSVQPRWLFDKAKVIVSIDCDFLGSESQVQNHIRRFAQGRQLENGDREVDPGQKRGDALSRLYVAETVMSLTGFNADHRLRLPSSALLLAARTLAAGILQQSADGTGIESLQNSTGQAVKWLAECARDLRAHRGESLVVAGHRQPLAVHLLAYALNDALETSARPSSSRKRPRPRRRAWRTWPADSMPGR